MELFALVIDDDARERRILQEVLSNEQWNVAEAESVAEAMLTVPLRSWRLVFCDARLAMQHAQPSSELTLLEELKRRGEPSAYFVVTVPARNRSSLLEVFLNGAPSYIGKPYRETEIREHSRRVKERLQAAKREELHRSVDDFQTHAAHDEYALVGESRAVLRVFEQIAKSIGQNSSNVKASTAGKHFLLTGETGTGKELVARLIHRYSRYSKGSFVPVNCSTLPVELADSELFGSNPGAFTGADRHEHHGLWEMANGGTLFLDEITEAPRAVMPKLLRVLQDGQVRRLGAKRWVETDVQVIAATNRNLEEEVRRGRFREDLYHRLSQHRIHLPPIRERIEDVSLLAAHFAYLQSGGTVRFAQDALHLLTDFSREYEWRGNVRELENVVRRVLAHAHDRTVYAVDLAPHLPAKADVSNLLSLKLETAVETAKQRTCACGEDTQGGLDEQVRRFRYSVIKETLAAHNNCRTRAAKSLQISRSTMHRLIDELEQEHNLR